MEWWKIGRIGRGDAELGLRQAQSAEGGMKKRLGEMEVGGGKRKLNNQEIFDIYYIMVYIGIKYILKEDC